MSEVQKPDYLPKDSQYVDIELLQNYHNRLRKYQADLDEWHTSLREFHDNRARESWILILCGVIGGWLGSEIVQEISTGFFR